MQWAAFLAVIFLLMYAAIAVRDKAAKIIRMVVLSKAFERATAHPWPLIKIQCIYI